MKVFVVGNGFDRGHGLPTSYWDFRTYLELMYSEFLYAFEEHYHIYPGMDADSKRNLLWNRFETNLANIDEDIIIEQATRVELGLESGEIGIEDTLYHYFSEEYEYIERLARYLKQWVRTIKIKDTGKRTSAIAPSNDAMYVTFNYTAVLENIYHIPAEQVIHVHGSLRQCDGDPILGHGNWGRIENIQQKRLEANRIFDEKEASICRVIENYYQQTYKDVSRYTTKLHRLDRPIDEVVVIGHSIDGVDMPYFNSLNIRAGRTVGWKVYYHSPSEEIPMKERLIECGIAEARIDMCPSNEFYDIEG